MANTEGMPDEVLETLLGNPSAESTTRQQRLQQRMNMPIGGQPAATVIRTSPRVISSSSTRAPSTEVNRVSETSPRNVPSKSAPIVGNVIERPLNFGVSSFKARERTNSKGSRFAQQQKLSSASTSKHLSSPLNINGFPSVNVPLGTFVNKRVTQNGATRIEKKSIPPKVATSGVSTSAKSAHSLSSIRQEKSSITPKAPTTAKDAHGIAVSGGNDTRKNDISKLLDESDRQAHSMLAQMSEVEISENIKDLESSVPPELQLFLKKRGAAKKRQQQMQQSEQSISNRQRQAQPVVQQEALPIQLDEIAEKKRVADLVSSIKSVEELDVVYKAEQNKQQPVLTEQESVENDRNQNGDETDDFALACSLLRSTVPRQRLWGAKTVCSRLQCDYERYIKMFRNGKWEGRVSKNWPIVLPVSLRCLLDQPPHHSNSGYLVHTYVLQSIFFILVLTVHPDHVVAIDSWKRSTRIANSCFQSFYLDDAVPTPPLGDCYRSTQPIKPLTVDGSNSSKKRDKGGHEAVAYSTSSSSSSAQADGEAFEKDPLWTLLSRMRILPRVAQLLDLSSLTQLDPKKDDPSTYSRLPQEALVAICGIFAMLSQRSPGAASAIVHHETLLQQLLDHTLLRFVRSQLHDNESDSLEGKEHLQAAIAAVTLLCTLARQSRVTAAKLLPFVIDDVFPAILSKYVPSEQREMRLLQQSVLILWRTLLRLGLGLARISTILSLAAPHLALKQSQDEAPTSGNLGPFFLSGFAQVLECVRFAKMKSPDEARKRIPQEDLEFLSLAGAWLSSTKQTVLTLLSSSMSPADTTLSENFRSKASELRFLSSYYALSTDLLDQSKDEIKVENVFMDDVSVCLQIIRDWTSVGGAVDRAWKIVSPFSVRGNHHNVVGLISSSTSAKSSGEIDWELEASACAFLDSTVATLLTIENIATLQEGVRYLARGALEQLVERLLDGLRDQTSVPIPPEPRDNRIEEAPFARRGWINQCLFGISKLLFHSMSVGAVKTSADVGLVRLLVFSLLGRLDRGSESMAAVLYSQDSLFRSISNPPLQGDDLHVPKSSPLSDMFMKELCGSNSSRQQLDHSFKLQRGFGITSDGFGAFMLHSLRSDSDQGPKQESSGSGELLLPLGRMWLWQTLSGSIQTKDESLNAGTSEASNVVSACLGLVLDVEQDEELLNQKNGLLGPQFGYAGRIPIGARLYYIMNVCLHPEAILREDSVAGQAEAVLDLYLRRIDSLEIDDFATACLHHTNPTNKDQTASEEEAEKELNENEKKIASTLLHPEVSTTATSDFSNLTSQQMRALEAFLEDLTSSYIDYGAQYSFFTKCVRIFLLPMFPSPLRCRVLRELRGMLHLLTLPHELDDPSGTAMRTLVEQAVSGRLKDGSHIIRDTSDILDLASSILGVSPAGGGGGNQRPLEGYVLNYAIALLIRNVSNSCFLKHIPDGDITSAVAREACKKRLLRLEVAVVKLILNGCHKYLSTGDGDSQKCDFVNVVMDCATLYPMTLVEEKHERINGDILQQLLDEANELLSDKKLHV